uniref:CSON008550 protein n=1 Tax=Culicoides sonorensis TaxID=179676 RepID=A0A336MWL2_CULSO
MFKEIFVLSVFIAIAFAIPAPADEISQVNQPLVQDVELVDANDDLEGAEHHYRGYGGYGRGYGGYGGYGRGYGGYGGYGRGYGGYGGYGRGYGGYGGYGRRGYWG